MIHPLTLSYNEIMLLLRRNSNESKSYSGINDVG